MPEAPPAPTDASPPAPPQAAPPTVSVVMTTYDAIGHVAEAVESVFAQTFPDWELVIVDDGSTDGTRELLQEYAEADARVRLLLVPRMGRIPALNTAVREARGEFIANLDADDISYPDRLQREVDYLRAHPDVGLVGASVVDRIDDQGRPLPPVTRPTDEDEIRRLLGRQGAFFHSSVMYRRSVWRELGGFDTTFSCYEDYDFVVRMLSRSRVHFLEGALGAKRRHPGQAFDQVHWTNKGPRLASAPRP